MAVPKTLRRSGLRLGALGFIGRNLMSTSMCQVFSKAFSARENGWPRSVNWAAVSLQPRRQRPQRKMENLGAAQRKPRWEPEKTNRHFTLFKEHIEAEVEWEIRKAANGNFAMGYKLVFHGGLCRKPPPDGRRSLGILMAGYGAKCAPNPPYENQPRVSLSGERNPGDVPSFVPEWRTQNESNSGAMAPVSAASFR